MTIRRSLLLAGALTLALTLPAAVSAAPTAVDVRIEGKTSTIFDAPVTTDGKTVTTASGGTHTCDGTNLGASPAPVANATSALDDAAIKGGFDWDGTWSGPGYPDYFITRIAGETEIVAPYPGGEYWSVFINGVATSTGGCQALVKAGDEVLWSYDAFNKVGGLKLAAPGGTRPGIPIVARATDIATGAGVAGVTIGSETTGADGNASLTFTEPGVYVLKADKADRVRSRSVRVCVDPPGAEECTYGDKTAPAIRLDAPELASDLARFGNRVPLSWQGDDPGGSGIKRYRIEVRRVGKPDTAWRLLRTDTASTKGRLNGTSGVAYELRVRAYDRANNASVAALSTTIVPLDNLNDSLRFSKRGWKVLSRQGAWQLSTSRATRPGASASLRFTGSGATIVTRKLPNGGRVRVTVDGDSKIVSLKGKSRFRRKLVGTGKLAAGQHTLRVTSLSRAPVEIDAIAVRP
ncbi:MAG TPA: DUF4430 domain-containing protein [Thermoleophilaceae bacterium]|nr:DUF4430 domain-containing protein [Thermoleophilaceae bacterium]